MIEEQDWGTEEVEWPEPGTMRLADAVQMVYDIETQATAANKRAETLKTHKVQAHVILEQVIEREELESARARTRQGKIIQYTPGERDEFTFDNEDEFKAWAAERGDENYYDPEPKLRKDIFRDEMRRRVQDKEPLPPGVRRVGIPTLNRTAVATKRRV